jgi:hypothetical protein
MLDKKLFFLESIEFSKNIDFNDDLVFQDLINSYQYYSTLIDEDGSMRDPFIKSKIDFQYHTAYYVLTSFILSFLSGDRAYEAKALKTLNYIVGIGNRVNRDVNPFICIAMCLSHSFTRDERIKKTISKYISELEVFPSINQNKKSANNFYALKALALVLRSQINESQKDINEAQDIIFNLFIHWQDEDGFFYDKPFDVRSKSGTVHLTYHATMWMIMTSLAMILDDKTLKASAVKAFNALKAVTSPTGLFSYGRSNNASFGHSSALLAGTLQSILTDNGNGELAFRDLMFGIIDSSKSSDGHLRITPNNMEKERMGFDKYMFVSVYGAWTLSLTLLSHTIKPLQK